MKATQIFARQRKAKLLTEEEEAFLQQEKEVSNVRVLSVKAEEMQAAAAAATHRVVSRQKEEFLGRTDILVAFSLMGTSHSHCVSEPIGGNSSNTKGSSSRSSSSIGGINSSISQNDEEVRGFT
jgi:hypothetical protein